MKAWRCVLLAWLGVVCVLLGLCPQDAEASLKSDPHMAACDQSLGPLGEPAPTWRIPQSQTARSPGIGETRAGPLASLVVPFVLLIECVVNPPSWESRGPPGSVPTALVHGSAAGQAGSRKQRERTASPRKSVRPSAAPRPRGGFCNSL